MKRILGVYAVFGLLVFAPLARADTVRLQAEDYKDGGEGVGYSDADVGNNGGGYLLTTSTSRQQSMMATVLTSVGPTAANGSS